MASDGTNTNPISTATQTSQTEISPPFPKQMNKLPITGAFTSMNMLLKSSPFPNACKAEMRMEASDRSVEDQLPSTKCDKKPSEPKRPLSAYNHFFQAERKRLLAVLPTRPEGKPRRSHGKIGFADLARSVSQRWKTLSAEERAPFHETARLDRLRYKLEKEGHSLQQVEQLKKQDSSPLKENEFSRIGVEPISPIMDVVVNHPFAGECCCESVHTHDFAYLRSNLEHLRQSMTPEIANAFVEMFR